MRLVQASLLACGLAAAACGSLNDSSKTQTAPAESVMSEEAKAAVPQYLLVKIDHSTGAVYTAVTNEAPAQLDVSKPENVEAVMKKEAEIFANAEAVTVLASDAEAAENSSESYRGGRFGFGGGCGGFGGCGGIGFGGCGVGIGGCGGFGGIGFGGCGVGIGGCGVGPVVGGCGVGVSPCGPYFGFGGANYNYGYIGRGFYDNCTFGRFGLSYLFNGAGFAFGSFQAGFGQGYAQGFGNGVIAGSNNTMLDFQGTPLYPQAAPVPGAPGYGQQAPYPQSPYQQTPYQQGQYQQGQYQQQYPYQQTSGYPMKDQGLDQEKK